MKKQRNVGRAGKSYGGLNRTADQLAEAVLKWAEERKAKPEPPPTEKLVERYRKGRGEADMKVALKAVEEARLIFDSEGGIWKTGGVGVRADRLQANGYRMVNIDGVSVLAHRLIWTVQKGPIALGMHMNHIDGNRGNNVITNLEVVTPAGNARHASRVLKSLKGTFAERPVKGEEHHLAKLNPEKVREIRKMLAAGLSQRAIAREFEVSQIAIWNIAQRRTWRDVV